MYGKQKKSTNPYLAFLGWPCIKAYQMLKDPVGRIFALRVLMALSLVIAAVIVGVICYVTLAGNERDYAISQYDAITEQGLNAMVEKFSRMNTGTAFMAKIYRHAFPDPSQWPNVALPGFYDMAQDLAKVAALNNVVFQAFVPRKEFLANFTEFAYDYWASEFAAGTERFTPFTGYSPVGPLTGARGVWGIDPRMQNPMDYFYVDETGDVFLYPSSRPTNVWDVAVQLSFSTDVGPELLGYNSHTSPLFGPPSDQIVACVERSANYSVARSQCGFLSPVIPLPPPLVPGVEMEITGLQSFLTQPIILRHLDDPEKGLFVGTLTGMVNWKTMLESTVPSYIEGIDCVVSAGDSVFTYSIQSGEAQFKGLGDLHDSHYNEYDRSINLLEKTSVGSFTPYRLIYYPRRAFFKSYETDAPLYTTTGAVAIILFCCIVFVVYDVSISRESSRKEVVLDTKRRFVRFISHEIRTPLNTVRLGLKLLEMELNGLANQIPQCSVVELADLVSTNVKSWLQLADDILGNSDSAVDVLNDLLNYDKIEMGTLRLEFSSVAIWALVKKTVAAFVMQAKQKNIDLQLVGECWSPLLSEAESGVYDQLRVVGDSMRIAQVLRNLISNALKFTPEQGKVIVRAEWNNEALPNAVIKVASDQAALLDEPRAGSIRVAVTDSGAGLSPEQLAQICSEGVQFNANQLQAGGGSGLGLFISKGMVEAHGGTLKVTSEGLGKGATFTMELPLFRFEEDLSMQFESMRTKPMPSPRAPGLLGMSSKRNGQVVPLSSKKISGISKDSRAPSLNVGPRRVLVVDDADSNRKLLMRILTAKGYLCDGACNGQEALNVFSDLQHRGELVDAVLMDYEMPVLNGPDATRKLRDMGCESLIIGVTGNVLPSDVDLFKERGANTVLAKPLNIEAFESFLRAFRSARKMAVAEPVKTPVGTAAASSTEQNAAVAVAAGSEKEESQMLVEELV